MDDEWTPEPGEYCRNCGEIPVIGRREDCCFRGCRLPSAPETPPPDLDRLRAAVKAAEDSVYVISMSDDFAYTNGSYDAARRVLDRALRALADAEAKMNEAAPA